MVAISAPIGTLAINAAFLQEIKDSNPSLWQTQQQLRQACLCDLEPMQLTRRLVRLLDEFRDQLSMQFALEESYGYQPVSFDVANQGRIHPDRILAAQGQHCGLYLEVTELAERAEELQYRGVEFAPLRQLVADTQQFDERLCQHEQLEQELIQQAYR